jgi:shikimate kinase
MKVLSPIYLIGFMASGKSSLGPKLAKRLGLEFLDLDVLIEEYQGQNISSIFEQHGEAYFRKLETELLNRISTKPAVIALGGGTICSQPNLKKVKETGLSFYLRVKEDVLFGRLKKQKASRPLIADLDNTQLKSFIKDTLEKRELHYLQASFVIEKDKVVPNDLIPLINSASSSKQQSY